MKTIKYVFGLLILLSSYTYSQEDLDPVKYSSFEGTHFYIGYMQNEISIDPVVGLLLQAYIVSTSKATVTVQLPWGNKKVYTLEKDSVLKLDFDEILEARESEVATKELVEITSDVPINVYAFNSQVTSSDSYSAVPVSSWGNEYVVMSYCNDQYAIYQEMASIDSAWYNYPRQSEFMVLAAYDETQVVIKPTSLTEKGMQAGKNYVVNLNKGQCYLVKSVLAPRGYADLTGSIVKANKPIGVISGHVRTAIPWYLPNPWDSKDHIAEMLTPTEAWGKNFITVPFGLNPKGDLVRVVNILENTTVRCETEDGIKTFLLKQPGSVDSMMYLNLPAHWSSDKPVQLAQYMVHSGIEGKDSRYYDPSMVIISPIEQYVSKIVFQTPGNPPENWGQFIQHQVSFVVDKKAKDYLTLDGEPVKNLIPISSNNVFNTDYYWGVIEITKGKHKLLTNNGFFSGIVYGNGAADSYAMTLGSSLISPNRKDSISPSIEYSSDCGVLEGIIYERKSDINASGLSYILVDEDNTYNYDYKISPMTDTSYYITFNAKPIDKLKKAQLMIDVRDKAGNGKRLNYIYEPISIKTPKEIMFWGIDIKDSSCVDFYIINNGDSAITLENIDIFEELRLSYYVSKNYVTKTSPL